MNNTNLPMAAAAPTTDHDDYEDVIDDIEVELGNQEEKTLVNNPFVTRMKKFTDKLLARPEKVPFMKFFIEARRECFQEIMFNFMGYFLTLTTKNELFCVPHTKLQQYGVINDNRSNNILACLEQYDLINDEDYHVLNVQHMVNNRIYNRKVYMLTQDAFKLCLMRAKNSRQFAYYYLMLEKVIGFHQRYLDKYNERVVAFKDEKIDQLLLENQDLKADIQKVLANTNNIVNQNEGLKQQANDLSQQVAGISVQNTMLTYKVDSLVEHLYERNPKLPKENDQPTFLLVKILDSEHTYKVYRTAKSQVERLLSGNGERYKVLINQFDPNPGNHYKRFHAFVKKELYEFITAIKRSQYMSKAQKEMQLNMYTNQPPIYINGTDIIINPKLMTEERLLSRFNLINTLRMRINGNVMKKSNAEQA